VATVIIVDTDNIRLDVAPVNIFPHARGVPASDKPRDAYHHGDLRPALLDAAVALIGEVGLPALSLRECARRAGVSHAAPYRHFADKEALLLAIAEQGFEWLADAAEAAMAKRTAPDERLDAYGVAYVRFAAEHPVHHRVMFSASLGVTAKEHAGDDRAFDLLLAAARDVVGDSGADPLEAALAAWSLPHGLTMLILDGRIPARLAATPALAEGLARRVIQQWRGPLLAKAAAGPPPASKSRHAPSSGRAAPGRARVRAKATSR
jgi:AcrR family transcriptional regulator